MIVTSWVEQTDDKRILNKLAIERLGINCEYAAALLIDNKKTNVEKWMEVGGAGYHFVGDESFARDVVKGVNKMAQRSQPSNS